jgi:hypothetical protein
VSEHLKSVIALQVDRISELVGAAAGLPVARLREEATELQVLLAEAARLERIGLPDGERSPVE